MKRRGVPSRAARRPARLALAAVALVLLLTANDRHLGSVADGRQMIWTAIAIAETGGIGQARGRDFTLPRSGGDAVSRYGMGMTFAQLPAAVAAPWVESRLGAGTSRALFLLAPLLLVLAAAAAAGRAARLVGAGPIGEALAVVLASLGSPLASYAAMEFSEPLQAAALGLAYALALAAAHAGTAAPARRAAALAGLAAGVAVLTKSGLAAVAPLALVPLLAGGGPTRVLSRLGAAALGAATPFAVWLGFELTRFGHPFGGYVGEGFTHPPLDGAWRLLVGPNKGLVLFFPALLACLAAFVRELRPGDRPAPDRRLDLLGAALPFAALLGLASAYFGWHGAEGWGPRLLVPAIPLLAPWAALEVERWRPAVRRLAVVLSLLANALPLVQHPTPIASYVSNCVWPPVDQRTARAVAPYVRRRAADGSFRLSPDYALATVPRASPFLVFPWFLGAAWSGDDATAARILERPPWASARPEIHLRLLPLPPELARFLARPWRLRYWGRSFLRTDPGERDDPAVYDEGLIDQVVRAQQVGQGELALRLAGKLHRLAPSGQSVALVLESYRILGRVEAARGFLGAQPVERRADLRINVVLALFQRDAGDEAGARRLLANAAPAFPEAPLQAALAAPLALWPDGLEAMTVRPLEELVLVGSEGP